MGNVTIPQLPVATSLTGDELVVLSQLGVMKSATARTMVNTQGDSRYAALAGSSAQNFAANVLTASADSVINGVSIGKGSGGVIGNIVVGVTALQNNTTAFGNTAIGTNTLQATTSGFGNTATGLDALQANTTGNQNTATGLSALQANTTGTNNTAVGASTLQHNTTGFGNTAIGTYALQNNTTGNGNTAISPLAPSGAYSPVFDPTTESNRFCMGSTTVTNAYVQVAWTVVSDARDKAEFAPVPCGLDFVTKLQPVAYRYRVNRDTTECHGPVRYGFRAQDVLELEGPSPVIVDAEDPEKLRFNDQSMLAVLVKAIQELKADFDAYKANH